MDRALKISLRRKVALEKRPFAAVNGIARGTRDPSGSGKSSMDWAMFDKSVYVKKCCSPASADQPVETRAPELLPPARADQRRTQGGVEMQPILHVADR